MQKSKSAVLFARSFGLCLMALVPNCGTDRNNPALPNETFAENPIPESTEVRDENVSVLATQLDRDLPVSSSSDTIVYTPAEVPQRVPTLTACTNAFQISAVTNPFLAGMPTGSQIAYTLSTDRAPANGPTQLTAIDAGCMDPGKALYFRVDGKIAFGDLPGQEANADGQSTKVVQHTLGNVNRIAAVAAPIASLIGIFLDATPTQQRNNTPPNLTFRTDAQRNFKSLSPAIGQIFFIGDGKDSTGAMQAFIVPQGATRLYVAIMDEYEWNNNLGKLSVSATWLKP